MLTRTIAVFTLGLAAVLFSAAKTEAQPGRGPRGPEAGPDIEKLERDLNRLLEQVKETQAKIARIKGSAGKKEGKGFEGKKGFEGPFGKGFEGKGPFGPMAKGPGGFGPGGEKGFGKMDPETIKQRYEFYKKLYEESQREARSGKGGAAEARKPEPTSPLRDIYRSGTPGDVEVRIDRLIRELEQLRSEVRGGGRKKGRD